MTATTSRLTEDALASVVDLAREQAPSLQVSDLADHAGYSPFHFSRMFSARLGIGPGQYLIALRIARAKDLLLADEYPVIDVACAVGFDSLSSFSRRFRSTVGVAPGQSAARDDGRGPLPAPLRPAAPAPRGAGSLAARGADRAGTLDLGGWYLQPPDRPAGSGCS